MLCVHRPPQDVREDLFQMADKPAVRSQQGKARNRGRRRPEPVSGGSLGSAPPSVGFTARMRYRFDQTISKGTIGVIAWLGAITLVVIVISATIALLIGAFTTTRDRSNWPESAWQAMLRIVDAGTFAGDSTWPIRILGLLVTLAGIFIAGSLIGLIANAVDRKVDELSKGRGQVIEHDHTLVLGWNGQVATLVNELAAANENQKDPVIVFLVSEDKAEVDQTLDERVPDTRGSRLVVRTGHRSSPDDLLRVGIQTARSVIVLSGEDGDPGVVKCLLAIRAVDPEFDRPIVAEISDREIASSVRSLIGGVVTVNPDVAIAEVTAQACRQAGLSYVFKELLDFDGDEIYIAEVDGIVGRTYGYVQQCFARSAVIGRQRPDGVLDLNPMAHIVFEEGDKVVAITADDDTLVFAEVDDAADITGVDLVVPHDDTPLHMLIMGWSGIGAVVLRELDEFVAPGTRIDVLVDPDVAPVPDLDDIHTVNAVVNVQGIARSSVRVPPSVAATPYTQLIVLGYRDSLDRNTADSRTLLTLLALRKAFGDGPRLVGQILDPADVDLAQTTGVDDLVVSDNLGCLMIAQLSENPSLDAVFQELFDPDGSFMSLAPAHEYAPTGSARFNDIVRVAAAKGQTAIGHRVAATGEVLLNPDKSATLHFADDDQIVIIAGRSRLSTDV